VAYQVGMIMSFANNSFNQAWTPFLFSKLKTGNKQALSMLNKFNYAYFVFMLLLAMVIYFIVPFIYEHLIGKDFKVDFSIILWVLLGYALNGMYKILVNYLFYFKKTKRLALITIIAALLNVFFCILLVQELGILGASISTTIAFFVMFALVYIEYLKIYRIEKTN
jgi:O-antigen/teichoic acid export membrane protein